jgi:GTP cyclohydrolase I
MEKALMQTVIAAPQVMSEDARSVRDALIMRGLETPLIENGLTRDQKFERIKDAFEEIASTLGLDLEDDSLCDTPKRIAKMYVDEIFSGLDYARFPKATAIDNKMGVEEMVRIDDICMASVAYIPASRIIGLSKVNRIVRFFAQRPQVQERLTQQVLVALQTLLETENVAVSINAVHYCVKARGVMDSNSRTRTTALGGQFKKDSRTRAEFLSA